MQANPSRLGTNRLPRVAILACILAAPLIVIEWRLIQLQVLRHDELEEKAADYRLAIRTEQSWRGQIQDRNGVALALTMPVKNVYTDLAVWINRVELLAPIVAPLLGTEPASLAQQVHQSLICVGLLGSVAWHASADPEGAQNPVRPQPAPTQLLLF